MSRHASKAFLPAVLVCAFLLLPLASDAAPKVTGPVVHVTDGDTITILARGTLKTIRLYGIDAPALAQPYGDKAMAFVMDWVASTDVTVTTRGKDRYHRLIGDVRRADGQSLSEALTCAGYAWWFRSYAPKDAVLARCEADARFAQRGLWKDKRPVPPWDWRKGIR